MNDDYFFKSFSFNEFVIHPVITNHFYFLTVGKTTNAKRLYQISVKITVYKRKWFKTWFLPHYVIWFFLRLLNVNNWSPLNLIERCKLVKREKYWNEGVFERQWRRGFVVSTSKVYVRCIWVFCLTRLTIPRAMTNQFFAVNWRHD